MGNPSTKSVHYQAMAQVTTGSSMSSNVEALRICHLIAPGPIAGAERVVLCGCEALQKLDLTLTLTPIRDYRVPSYAEDFAREAAARELPLSDFIHAKQRIDFGLIRSLRDFFSSTSTQIVHTHGYKAFLYSLMARPQGVRVVHTHHGDTSLGWVMKAYQLLTYINMKRADGVFAVSDKMHKQLLRYVPEEKLHLVENMLVLPNLSDLDKQSGRDADGNYELVVVGRLSPEKGLNVLLEAVADLRAEKPRLVFVGEGGEENALREQAIQLGLQDDVEFVGFQSDVLPYLTKADGLAIPSFREGLPLTLIEAAAVGLPVVGTLVGGIPSIVEHGQNGILCLPNDVPALAQALRTFLHDLTGLKEIARQRREEIRHRFSPKKWATDTVRVYHRVIQ